MSTQAPVPKDHPLMIAWEAYKSSDDYRNTKRWAAHPEHIEGCLWAAFVSGFVANIVREAPAASAATVAPRES